MNYLAIVTKIVLSDEGYKSLGNKIIIDLENKNEITHYIEDTICTFSDKVTNSQYDPKQVTKIVFDYRETSKVSYNSYIKKLNRHLEQLLDLNIGKGIKEIYNLPFNNNYKSWGSVKILNSSDFTVSILDFIVKTSGLEPEPCSLKVRHSANRVLLSYLALKFSIKNKILF